MPCPRERALTLCKPAGRNAHEHRRMFRRDLQRVAPATKKRARGKICRTLCELAAQEQFFREKLPRSRKSWTFHNKNFYASIRSKNTAPQRTYRDLIPAVASYPKNSAVWTLCLGEVENVSLRSKFGPIVFILSVCKLRAKFSKTRVMAEFAIKPPNRHNQIPSLQRSHALAASFENEIDLPP